MEYFDSSIVGAGRVVDRIRAEFADFRRPLRENVLGALEVFNKLKSPGVQVTTGVNLLSRIGGLAQADADVRKSVSHGHGHELILGVLRFIGWRLDEITGVQAAEVLLALAKNGGSYGPQIMHSLAEVVRDDIQNVPAGVLARVVRAVDALKMRHDDLLLDCFHRLVVLMPDLERPDILALDTFFSGVMNQGFVGTGMQVAEAGLGQLSDVQLKRCAWVIGDFPDKYDDGGAFAREISARLVKSLEVGSELVEAAAETIIATARLNRTHPDLFRLFSDKAQDRLGKLSTGQMSWLPWAYYRLRFHQPAFLERVGVEMISRLDSASGEEVSRMIGALRRFGIPHEPLLVAVSQHYEGNFTGFGPRDLVELAMSFALIGDRRGVMNVQALASQLAEMNSGIEAQYCMHLAKGASGTEELTDCPTELRQYALSQIGEACFEVSDKVCLVLEEYFGVDLTRQVNSRFIGAFLPDLTVTVQGKKVAFLFSDSAKSDFIVLRRAKAETVVDMYLKHAGYEPCRVQVDKCKALEGKALARYIGQVAGLRSSQFKSGGDSHPPATW